MTNRPVAGQNGRPTVSAYLSRSFGAEREPTHEFRGLIDTGADGSVVRRPILRTLNLVETGRGKVFGPDGGSHSVNTTQMGLRLSPAFGFKELTVAVVDWELFGCDVLIGMDYLIQFDFAVRRGTFGPI